jgi:hypothetical protein
MVTKDQVLALIRDGDTYEAAGRHLGIPPGKAYMIATGIPADGSDSLSAEDMKREGLRIGSTQHLLGVPHHNPNTPDERRPVMDWVRDRARVDNRP